MRSSDPGGKAFRGDAEVSKTSEPGSSPGAAANLEGYRD